MVNNPDNFPKILVTGSKGQLGSELKELAHTLPEHTFLYTDIEELDITCEKAISDFFNLHKPDFVINCAAYTAVDRAEQEPEKAFEINAMAPRLLAKIAKSFGSKLIHLSTDYVFSGKSWKPYNEDDATDPISVYGKSKLKGEELLAGFGNTMIIRTSWLYSMYGTNFLKTIIRKGNELPELRVVFDQVGCPTWAKDLAVTILSIVGKGKEKFQPQIFHYSNEGVCSWFDFAKEIADIKNLKCKISAILTYDYPTPAARPAYSVLDKSKIKKNYGIEIPHWRNSLINCLNSQS